MTDELELSAKGAPAPAAASDLSEKLGCGAALGFALLFVAVAVLALYCAWRIWQSRAIEIA